LSASSSAAATAAKSRTYVKVRNRKHGQVAAKSDRIATHTHSPSPILPQTQQNNPYRWCPFSTLLKIIPVSYI